jgi:aryl sulfotransferase
MKIRDALRNYRTWSLDSRRWAHYRARPDDIIICTAPKTGTTWMQRIVSLLIFQDTTPRPIPAVSPWFDARFKHSVEEVSDAAERQTHRRFLKSHIPIDGMPLHDDVRYIVVARDGRDTVLSMHNHFSGFTPGELANFDRIGLEDPTIGRPYPRLPADPAAYFRQWITTPAVAGESDGLPVVSFFGFQAGYWAERRRPNVLLVHYADLLADLDGEMRRVAAFLDIAVDDALWPSLVRAAGFGAMREDGDALMPMTKTMFAEGSRRFFNKGTNGRWQGLLTDEDLAHYEAKVAERFTPGLRAWVEGGRAATGDPRAMAD